MATTATTSAPLLRVRREIRSLSAGDWKKVVDALWLMKTTTAEDGLARFGRNFCTYDSLVKKHVLASLHKDGDQAHFTPVFPIFHKTETKHDLNDPHQKDGIEEVFNAMYLL